MPSVPFTPAAYDRGAFGLPVARLQNLYVEKTGAGPTETARLPRPSLVESSEYGSGPVRGFLRKPGVFSGDLFTVSGTTAYRAGASIGTIAGTGLVRMDASGDTVMFVTPSGAAYRYTSAGLVVFDDIDLGQVIDVCFVGSRFVFARKDSGVFVWTPAGDYTSIEGLDFATAEGNPDNLVACSVDGDTLVLHGSASTEFWDQTGDDPPFQRISGARFGRGCAAQGSVTTLDNALAWIADDRTVYLGGTSAQRISNHGVEAALTRCTSIADATAYEARIEGHVFLVVVIPGQTAFAYDVSTQSWAEWTSYGRDVFRGRLGLLYDGVTYVADDTTGQVYALTPGVYADDGQPVTYLASAFVASIGKPVRCDSIVVQGARGVGLSTGQGSAPITEIRWSDDQGKTWSHWRQSTPGAIGEYRSRAAWRRLGLIREPGRAFEVRTTDPVLAQMSALVMNEPFAHG